MLTPLTGIRAPLFEVLLSEDLLSEKSLKSKKPLRLSRHQHRSPSRVQRRGLCAHFFAVLGVTSRRPPPSECIARRAPRGMAPKVLSASKALEDAVEAAKSCAKAP